MKSLLGFSYFHLRNYLFKLKNIYILNNPFLDEDYYSRWFLHKGEAADKN